MVVNGVCRWCSMLDIVDFNSPCDCRLAKARSNGPAIRRKREREQDVNIKYIFQHVNVTTAPSTRHTVHIDEIFGTNATISKTNFNECGLCWSLVTSSLLLYQIIISNSDNRGYRCALFLVSFFFFHRTNTQFFFFFALSEFKTKWKIVVKKCSKFWLAVKFIQTLCHVLRCLLFYFINWIETRKVIKQI